VNAKRLTTPKEKVQQLQRKLCHAAKENKKRKFHALYDKVYREDILLEAWRRVRANKGSAVQGRVSPVHCIIPRTMPIPYTGGFLAIVPSST
jgi:hypothetical protein